MLWRFFLAFLLGVNVTNAIPQGFSSFQSLKDCAIQSMKALGQTDLRIQSAANNTWEDARVGAIIKPDTPALITFAKSIDEVSCLVKCATKNGYQPVPRSGRHNFEGWSALNNSLVIDVSQIRYIKVASDKNSATIAAGANLGEIYSTLAQIGKTFLGGICPTVALGGYLGVGGYNVNQRQLGLAVDQVISFKVVTATGSVLNASPSENSDLFYAARGGGTYGIVIEATVKILTFPRSAMVSADFDRASRPDVLKKWMNWAPKQPAAFTSQLNFYSNRSHLIGWYMGGSTADVQNIMATSGLLSVPNAKVYITGNCSTENSRLFWMDVTAKCTDDATALKAFLSYYNTAPIWLEPIQPPLRIDNQVAIPSAPPAKYWSRFSVVSKTFFALKSRPLSNTTLQEFSDRSGALADDRAFWAELTAFGVPNPSTTGSFPWLSDASVLMRIELPGAPTSTYLQNRAFLLDFEKWFRPIVGSASYSGYVDKDIQVNPLTAYYGSNICKLIPIKKKYDPNNIFRNPQSVPTTAPAGLC